MEINGIAHTMITSSDFDACVAFYRRLLPFMGLTHIVYDEKDYFYCIGGRTGFGVIRCADKYRRQRADQTRPGVHHICFRARAREDVDSVHNLVRELGAKVVRAPEPGRWAPGYYSVLFEDPDGVRLEVNYIPGKGLLAENAKSGRWSDPE